MTSRETFPGFFSSSLCQRWLQEATTLSYLHGGWSHIVNKSGLTHELGCVRAHMPCVVSPPRQPLHVRGETQEKRSREGAGAWDSGEAVWAVSAEGGEGGAGSERKEERRRENSRESSVAWEGR